MNYISLAAKYRPQNFAEVAGQDTVKIILSRAALENKIAPAYLLSGTRGVGKTTIARIFAKALNCAQAPTAEPCNKCEQCLRITQGNHVDVIEIDGASNRGIDDARRIREATQYAPMEGRYKVFIIDEAHMLTRESFNALLKTLEEPPPATTFILATTEAHKFPITIVSRCQHFVFKALPEAGLVAHLTKVLQQEQLSFEDAALRLIARRASGSVRDSMSLLGQTLALSNQNLTEAATRQVLGLAGQELMERLLQAIHNQDCIEVSSICQELLITGVDLGFFLRELTVLWRNLFILKQASGQKDQARLSLNLPETESLRLVQLSQDFELSFIHAAWQMILESQRQILTSLEPGSSLELLLLNLSLLPQLLSLETLDQLPSVNFQAARPAPPMPIRQPVAQAMPARQPVAPPMPVSQPVASSVISSETPPWEPKVSTPLVSVEPLVTVEPLVSVEPSWAEFLQFTQEHNFSLPQHVLMQLTAEFTAQELILECSSNFQHEQLTAHGKLNELEKLLQDYLKKSLPIKLIPAKPRKIEADLKQEYAQHPVVKTVLDKFNGNLVRCTLC